MRIKNANMCYTGGGIYLIYSELENGNFTISTNEFLENITIVSESVFESDNLNIKDDCLYDDWIDKNLVAHLTDGQARELNYSILKWIYDNKPTGNYNEYDLNFQMGFLKDTLEMKIDDFTVTQKMIYMHMRKQSNDFSDYELLKKVSEMSEGEQVNYFTGTNTYTLLTLANKTENFNDSILV